jgi:hypothetical protein
VSSRVRAHSDGHFVTSQSLPFWVRQALNCIVPQMKHEKITQGLNLLKHNELIFQLWKNYTKTIDIQSMMNFIIYICLESSPTYGLIIYSHFTGLIKILRHAISNIYGTFGHKKNKKWFFNFNFVYWSQKIHVLQRLFTYMNQNFPRLVFIKDI